MTTAERDVPRKRFCSPSTIFEAAALALTLGACSSSRDVREQHLSRTGPAPEAVGTAATPPAPLPQAPVPTAERRTAPNYVAAAGSPKFPVAWQRNPQHTEQAGQGHGLRDDIYPAWIGVNPETLRVDLHSEPANDDPKHPLRGRSVTPTLKLLVDQCLAAAPDIKPGRLGFGGPNLPILLARATLPKGELTFTFGAFDAEYTMLFANDERGLRPIEEEESKFYRAYPASPALGVGATAGFESPDCSAKAKSNEGVAP